MSYAATHTRASRTMAKKGAAVTWSLTTPGTYDSETDTYTTPVTDGCSGSAVEMDGDPAEYADLIALNPSTLFFTPTTYGDLPVLESTGTWAGATKTVKKIFPLRPDGTVIAARLVVV